MFGCVLCITSPPPSSDIAVSEDTFLSVNSDLNGPTPQFTLSCVSTGGPATTVTWTRDSVTFTRGTETVLVDPVTAQYTHTLTVSGRPEGLYTCTVSNSKPSEDSAQLNITSQWYNEFIFTYSKFQFLIHLRRLCFSTLPLPPSHSPGL